MQYFQTLPTITYYFENPDEYAKLKNIFYKLDVVFLDRDNLSIYRIDNIKRIDNISYEIYGTTEYWWLIALINNIDDLIFDLPIEEDILRTIANRRTYDEFGTVSTSEALEYYGVQIEELIIENDNKRVLTIVPSDQIGYVISEITKRI